MGLTLSKHTKLVLNRADLLRESSARVRNQGSMPLAMRQPTNSQNEERDG